jgi:ribosomal protein L11 methyltransferase
MKGRFLWKLSVPTSEQAADAVSDILAENLGWQSCVYTNFTTGKTIVAVYLESRPAWSKAAQDRLRKALRSIGTTGSQRVPAKIKLTKLRNEDWAESWKRHFKPLEIGAKLLVKPSWSTRRPKPGQVEVVLDPGMSFGTGQHPTTGFCLKELVRLRKPGQRQSFLDIGTGSGILAICAARLGYIPVQAIDLDRVCIKIARRNARLNKLEQRIRFKSQDIRLLPRSQSRYSLVCANLISNLLLAQMAELLATLKPGGILVLAGILTVEFDQVQTAYEAAGMSLIRRRSEGEWTSGSFVARS